MADEKNLYNLSLHEQVNVPDVPYMKAVRVPGGWLYCSKEQITFVPKSNEYHPNIFKRLLAKLVRN